MVGLLMFARRAQHGLWFLPFIDETMALLGGHALDKGYVLYRDFIDNHGPVLFMLTSAYGRIAGWSNPNWARMIPILTHVAAAAAIARSPLLSTLAGRLMAVGLFLGLSAAVWLFQGLYIVDFYGIAGDFGVIALALYAAPSWFGRPVRPALAFVAGLAASLLGFSAYSALPTVALFALAGLRVTQRRAAASFIGGTIAGSLAMLIWLAIFGDVLGYLAFHIAFNQTAFAPFIGFGPSRFAASLVPSLAPAFLVHSLALLAFAAGAALTIGASLRAAGAAGLPPCLLGLAGILMLNARGETIFKDGMFLLGSVGLLALMLSYGFERMPRPVAASVLCAVLLAGTELTVRHATTSPGRIDWASVRTQPHFLIARRATDPLDDMIRIVVHPGETFLAVPFRPEVYWTANRLPMRGFYEYQPWDAAYARSPWFGRRRDLCAALRATPPPLIFFDDWKMWGRYVAADYMPCLIEALKHDYRRLPTLPDLYVRSDRLSDAGPGAPAPSGARGSAPPF